MAVPNTNTFSLQDVIVEVVPSADDLDSALYEADDTKFDPLYKGSKNSLLNFRNYGNTSPSVSFTFSTTSTGTLNLALAVMSNTSPLSNYSWSVTGGLISSGVTTSIDFSGNTGTANVTVSTTDISNLKVIILNSFNITTIDISNVTLLESLACHSNSLTTLVISSNTLLTDLGFSGNSVSSLDVSTAPNLEYLSCGYNTLTALDVSSNESLRFLSCTNNNLTSLDVSNNTILYDLQCGDNNITSLSVDTNILLTNLSCAYNNLTAYNKDDLYIHLDSSGEVNGRLNIDLGRTSASDTARASLIAKGWAITEY